MTDMDQARETLAEFDRQIAKLEYETRLRIERRSGLDGDYATVSRLEWAAFNEQVGPMREQREAIAKAIANIVALETPPPMIVRAPSDRREGT